MRTNWYQSILFLTTVVVIGIAITVGTLFIIRAMAVIYTQTREQATARLNELIDTVESTVRIACFVQDKTLATEVVNGLLKNSTVLGVVIKTDNEELAQSYRKNFNNSPAPHLANQQHLVRNIYSPFNSNDHVGRIEIYPNIEELEHIVYKNVYFVAMLLMMQLAAVVAAIVLVIFRWIINPIKKISDYLHFMNPLAGDRLRLPYGHRNTEVGRLAEDINSLATRLVASLHDERQLRLQHAIDEKKYHAIFNNAETGIFIANQEGLIESANPALIRLFDLENNFLPSTQRLSDFTWIYPERLTELISSCIEKNSLYTEDLELKITNGRIRWLNLLINPIGENRVQGLLSDITERKQAENLAKLQAITDPVTGLANRFGFEQILQMAIQRSEHSKDIGFTLMNIDVDGFKRVNEAFGMTVGNQILNMVGERIRNNLKPVDTIARLGGDEFALVLFGVTNSVYVASIGRRLIRILEKDYEIDLAPIKLGASIGISIYPNDGDDMLTLLRNAELALQHARSTGGNCFRFFDQGMATAAQQRQTMETDMQLALKKGEFKLFYQPIIDIRANRLVGAEALIRWRHPEKGLVPPDAFIPLAEESDLIVNIGNWCLETACQQLATWKNEGKNYYISINISGRLEEFANAAERINAILNQTI